MLTNTVLNAMATFGYLMGFIGLAACVLAYFALPKLIKSLFQPDDKE